MNFELDPFIVDAIKYNETEKVVELFKNIYTDNSSEDSQEYVEYIKIALQYKNTEIVKYFLEKSKWLNGNTEKYKRYISECLGCCIINTNLDIIDIILEHYSWRTYLDVIVKISKNNAFDVDLIFWVVDCIDYRFNTSYYNSPCEWFTFNDFYTKFAVIIEEAIKKKNEKVVDFFIDICLKTWKYEDIENC